MFETWKEGLRLRPGWRRRVSAELAILAAVGVLMGVLGPYDSHTLPGVMRHLYWLLCIVGGGVIGIAIEGAIARWKLPAWRQVGAVSLFMTPPVALYVLFLSYAAFGSNVDLAGYGRALWQVFAIALPVTAVRALVWRRPEFRVETRTIVEPTMPEAEAAFRRRLSAKRRAARLIAVEAYDHYLRVHTDAGDELLTLRFADALAELARAHGYQVHRSWWVAADAIEGAGWRRGSGEVRLAGGLTAPMAAPTRPCSRRPAGCGEHRRAKVEEIDWGEEGMRVVRRALWALPCLGLLSAAGCATTTRRTRRIALTFDDAPLPSGPFFTGEERSRRIVAGLRRAGVREAAFFANPGRPEPDMEPRLRTYAGAGHALANHTATHPDLRNVSVETYLADIAAADRMLRPMPGFRPWFRFPYLSEGETVEKRDAVRRGLVAMGYEQGYVTADSYDWRLDQLAREAKTAGRTLNLDALRDLYVRSALEGADYFDRMAAAALRRSPRHVLLLHENDLAALFIADLVDALRRDGWANITASEAFSDPIASALPDTLALGEGRIAALVNAANARNRFPERRPSYHALDQPFTERVTGVR